MLRFLLIMGTGILLSSCSSFYSRQNPPPQSLSARTEGGSESWDSSINGVYKFVSRTTTLTAPKQRTEEISNAEWYGIWIFQDGYFSQTRAKIDRTGWLPGRFPESPDGIGFDGGSGTFSVHGSTLELKYHTSFYPGRTGTVETVQLKLENDMLTLTQDLAPHVESLATGQRITILQRLK